MKKRYLLLAGLALSHLVMVFCGALNIPVDFGSEVFDRATAYYKSLTGADLGYAFFVAPISSEIQANFRLIDAEGNVRNQSIAWSNSAEVNTRLHNTIETMINYENIQGGVAASLAAVLFGKHPDVIKIEVQIEGKMLPTMEQYRAGMRPKWGPAYRQVFERADYEPANKTA